MLPCSPRKDETILLTSLDVALARMSLLGVLEGMEHAAPAWSLLLNADKQGFETIDKEEGCVGMAALVFLYVRDAAERWLSIATRWDEAAIRLQIRSTTTATNEEKKDEGCCKANDRDSSTDGSCWARIGEQSETLCLSAALHHYLRLVQLDDTLAEEMARSGCHGVLSRLMRFELPRPKGRAAEEDQDVVMELQDLCCEIASHSSGSFPIKTAPFSLDELRQRLPIPFRFTPPTTPRVTGELKSLQPETMTEDRDHYLVLIRQVTGRRQSAQDDVGFVMWPSAVVLSSWLLSHPQFVPKNGTVLELGAGCGLVGQVAALMVKRRTREVTAGDESDAMCARPKVSTEVILSDFNSVVLDNLQRNIVLNGVEGIATTAKLDFYLQNGGNHCGGWKETRIHETTEEDVVVERAAVDLVLAADVICKRSDATAVVNSIYDSLRPGGNAVVVSAGSRHRYGVEALEEESRRVGLAIVEKVDDVLAAQTSAPLDEPLPSHVPFLSAKEQQRLLSHTTGYVEDMKLSLYRFVKPDQVGSLTTELKGKT